MDGIGFPSGTDRIQLRRLQTEMPQKSILKRPPLLNSYQYALCRGTVRTDSNELMVLYHELNRYIQMPVVWESSFSLACLVTDQPLNEPAAEIILNSMGDTESGAFDAEPEQQLQIARAALAVFEYSMNRNIIKRLQKWCRFIETSWDEWINYRWVKIQPADLMEFLIRFYRITGLKAILRLCARLRMASMDWTTILHNFHQRSPLELPDMKDELTKLFQNQLFPQIDFFSAQYFTNHGEILADAVRYTAYSALYSGNSQEISAGHKGWEYLKKTHAAVCGGTTSGVMLSGRGTNRGLHSAAVSAWAEAMIAQIRIDPHPWAKNELVRIVFNGLQDCIRHFRNHGYQFVNTLIGNSSNSCFDPESGPYREIHTLSRIARAAAMVWQNAICLSHDAVYFNYLLPGKYIISLNQQSVVFNVGPDYIQIRTKQPVQMNMNIFCSETDTSEITFESKCMNEQDVMKDENTGCLRICGTWSKNDTVLFHQGEKIISETCYHQGVCVFVRNRLMALHVVDSEYRYAVCGKPYFRNGVVFIPAKKITRWPCNDGIPGDLPVLPSGGEEITNLPLTDYSSISSRIAVFPREINYV